MFANLRFQLRHLVRNYIRIGKEFKLVGLAFPFPFSLELKGKKNKNDIDNVWERKRYALFMTKKKKKIDIYGQVL